MVPRMGHETWSPDDPSLTYSTLVELSDSFSDCGNGGGSSHDCKTLALKIED